MMVSLRSTHPTDWLRYNATKRCCALADPIRQQHAS